MQKLIEEETKLTPEAISDFINLPEDGIQPTEYSLKVDNVLPAQNSDKVPPQEETPLKERKKSRAKITSRLGKEALHKDLKLLTTLNKNGVPYMDDEANDEFILNVSGYSSVEPTDKVFNLNFLKKGTITRYVYQLCKKHKPDHMIDEEYAAILSDHILQFRNRSPQSIASCWSRTVRGKKQNYLKNDPYTIFVEP